MPASAVESEVSCSTSVKKTLVVSALAHWNWPSPGDPEAPDSGTSIWTVQALAGSVHSLEASSATSVSFAVALLERVRVPAPTAAIVVAGGMPLPVIVWPAAKGGWGAVAVIGTSVPDLPASTAAERVRV